MPKNRLLVGFFVILPLLVSEPSNANYLVCRPKGIIVGSQCGKEHHEELIPIAKSLKIPIRRLYLSEFENGFKLLLGQGDQYSVY